MTKISALTPLGDDLAVGDQFIIRDIDDTGTPNKSVTISGITRGLDRGTNAAPAIAFAADKNTGIYSPGEDQLAVATNGTGRLFIDANGSIGVGTSSPTSYGSGITTGSLNGSAGSITDFYFNGVRQGLVGTFASNEMLIDTAGAAIPLKLLTNSAERARIRADGTFEIKGGGTSGVSPGFSVSPSTPANSFVIDSSGRLLVGTSTGKGKLSILQPNIASIDGANSAISIVSVGGGAVGRINSIAFMAGYNIDTATASIGYICTDDAQYTKGDIFFATRDTTTDVNATERMRITSGSVNGANFLFNCTSLPSASVKGIGIAPNGANGNYIGCGTSSATSYNHFEFYNPNGTVGSISTNASATAYNTSSDYRLKENVAPVTDGITRLLQLKPSRFNFIADPDRTVDGFIAHEVQATVPEAITGEKDAVDADGNPVYQGIDQSKLVPLLTAALQEAIAKIETLEQRLTAAGID